MRKLASIQAVAEVRDIPGADLIKHYRINNWWVISNTPYQVGDLVVYFEIDSLLPIRPEYEFLRKSSYKKMGDLEGFRLRICKMRGAKSNGLLAPLSDLPPGDYKEGDDVTELLGVIKYEKPIPACLAGMMKGNFPSFCIKTEETRLQSFSDDEYNELKKRSYYVAEKLEGCFLLKQYIDTYDGGPVQLRSIVNGDRPTLIGVDDNGNVVPTKILNVFDNGNKSKWVDIKFRPYSASRICGKSGKLRTTPNHKIFTVGMNEVSASELKSGDIVYMQSTDYDNIGIHYILSSLLGDGSIGCRSHYSYNEGHSTKHDEFNTYILDIFRNVKTSQRIQMSGKGSEMRYIKAFATPTLNKIRREWYPEEKKALPKDLSWFDDFTIAKWYMDDGSLSHNEKQNDRARFSSQCFSEEDVQRLCDKLHNMYGVSAIKSYSRGWEIRVNYDGGSIEKLWESIAKHIHPVMRYKLPEKYRSVPFQHYGHTNYVRNLIPVQVLSVNEVEHNKKNFPSGSKGYDLETETGNYFCGGILVHNSSQTIYLNEDVFGVCSRNVDLLETDGNSYWQIARTLDLENRMRTYGGNFFIQGELIGPGIQGNYYSVNALDFYLFSAYDIDEQRYLTLDELCDMAFELQVKMVPVIDRHFSLTAKPADLLAFAEGKSLINENVEREGLVFRTYDKDVSFKAVSEKYLLGEKD